MRAHTFRPPSTLSRALWYIPPLYIASSPKFSQLSLSLSLSYDALMMAMEAIACGSASPSQPVSFWRSVAYPRLLQLGRDSSSRCYPTQRLAISITAAKRSPKRLKYSSPSRLSKVLLVFYFYLSFIHGVRKEENFTALLSAV